MSYNNRSDSRRSDALTTVVVSLLGLAAVAGSIFCLVYAIWWLWTFWAPW